MLLNLTFVHLFKHKTKIKIKNFLLKKRNMIPSWFVQNPNAFVFVLFAVIFLFFALLSLAHRSTLIFALFVGIFCASLGWYFLSPQSIIRQHAR